jgi:hypothetical protein
MITAQPKIIDEVESTDEFTLSFQKTVTDVDGNEVTIVDHTEDVSLTQLEQEKELLTNEYQRHVAVIQEKINAINNI